MPSSQLKRLKASLREQGILGPHKSKKRKDQVRTEQQNGKPLARNIALEHIREKFNPFEIKVLSRRSKYEFANSANGAGKGVTGRPGLTKGIGEETVRSLAMRC